MVDAEGNPSDEAEARAILRGGAGTQLISAAAGYVVPLSWELASPDLPPRILNNGTAFFLRVGGPTLLVTAAHVIRKLDADRTAHGPMVRSQLMRSRRVRIDFDPLPDVVDIDDKLDVATVRVPGDLPARVNSWIYQRPVDQWPPPPPDQGRGLFFAGFPGYLRSEPDPGEVEFGLFGAVLTATSVSQSRIVSQLDRDHGEPLPGLDPPPPNAWIGGMSGTPGWTLTQFGWRLAGVLYSYSTDNELFYFRSARCIRGDGSLIRDSESITW